MALSASKPHNPSFGSDTMTETRFLEVPEGRIAYSDMDGVGPVVILVPGLGDRRATFRFLVPRLAAAGFRVISVDNRGHGDSSTSFTDYSAASVGGDIVALVDALAIPRGRGVYLLGNSLAGAAAVWAAT